MAFQRATAPDDTVVMISYAAGRVRQLEEAEQLAVEQEDFESAANLSSELDGLRSALSQSRWSMLLSAPVLSHNQTAHCNDGQAACC